MKIKPAKLTNIAAHRPDDPPENIYQACNDLACAVAEGRLPNLATIHAWHQRLVARKALLGDSSPTEVATWAMDKFLAGLMHPETSAFAFLRHFGFAPVARTPKADTLLHLAMKCAPDDLLPVMLNSGIDVQVRNDFGATALHIAACFGRSTAIQALVGCGADINARDEKQLTPLHYVALFGPRNGAAMLRALVTAGARLDATDEKNNTALDVAQWGKRADLVETLTQLQIEQDQKAETEEQAA